jgi:hypothetical protein
MTQEQFNTLKTEFISNIKEYVTDSGGIFPHLSIFADLQEDDETKPALIHVPIPEELMMDDEGKDKFVNIVFPEIAKEVKKRNFKPMAIAWTAEAWVRTADKNKGLPEDWKKLPIEKEVVIITIESDDDKECVLYDIVRNGKQVNSDGEIVDNVTLIEAKDLKYPDGIVGRFSGLFSKLKD